MSGPSEVHLDGPGPFELPLCSRLESVTIGGTLAVLHFETLEGQQLDIPIPLGALGDISLLALQAANEAAGPREGTVQ
jgi:hypothetical protein